VLATVMYVTRDVDWYALGLRRPRDAEPAEAG
jgi:inner membrane protein involved in colicin E2 resistance